MKILLGRIFVGMLSISLLLFGLYHFYRYRTSTLHFETVLSHTVSRTLYGTGIAIRSERLIEASHFGVENFLHDDATRIGVGQVVVEFHQTDAGTSRAADRRQLREIEDEIQMLTAAQDRNVNNMSTADLINRDIRDRLGALRTVSATGQTHELEQIRGDLTTLINRRRIAVGEDENFSERIAQLSEKRAYLGVQDFSGDVVSVRAPVPGFFSSVHDGYEELINPAGMRNMRIDDFVEIINREPPYAPSGYIGRMVTSEIWHFAVPLDLHQAEWITRNQRVELEFDMSGRRVPATVYDIVFDNRSDIVVAIFRSNHMSQDIINLRVSDVAVHSTHHTGLRVNNAALYFRETESGGVERGVYVLEGNTIRFRTVHPIYEGPHFILSDPNPTILRPTPEDEDEDGVPRLIAPPVRKFDRVITGGVDLYDGRAVN